MALRNKEQVPASIVMPREIQMPIGHPKFDPASPGATPLPMQRQEQLMPEKIAVTSIQVSKTDGERPDRTFHIDVKGQDWSVELVVPESAAAKLQARVHALDLKAPEQDDLKRMS